MIDASPRHPALGPVVESYGPNIKVSGLFLVFGGGICSFVFLLARDIQDRIAWIVFIVLTAALAILLLSVLASRVWLHEGGISYRRLSGEGELRWPDLARIYFGVYEIHAHYVPLGTFYRLHVVGVHGQRLSFGERIRHADDLAHNIQHYTLQPLLQKALQTFQSQGVVDFGAIVVSREHGLTLKKWFHDKQFRWQDIKSYEFSPGEIRIEPFRGFSWKVSADDVANTHVLCKLLDEVMQQVWATSKNIPLK